MPAAQPRDESLQWIELTDFSPGIFSNNKLSGGLNVTSTNLALAQEAGTWGCRSLPTGGLGPLPRRKYSYGLTTYPDTGTLVGSQYIINGMATTGFVITVPATDTDVNHRQEVHMVLGYRTSAGGGTEVGKWIRERLYNTAESTETIYTDSAVNTSNNYQYAYLLKTRMNAATPTDIGTPVMACVWTSESRLSNINQVFPDPASASATGTIDLATPGDPYRRAVAHQGRIVLGKYIAYNRGATTALSTDENILWTEVNDNTLVTSNPAAFVPEVDATITDWCSMSANQLVVIKRSGGGYVLQGDLDDVTVVRLPNLKCSDGTAAVRGSHTPLGFIYSAGDAGLYLWNGGDTSEPISSQLDGQAFTDISGVDRSGLVGACDRWIDLFAAPGGWVMDLDTRGWWRLEHPSQTGVNGSSNALAVPIVHWSASSYEGQLVGSPQYITVSAGPTYTDSIFIYEPDDLTYVWQWQSHPIWLSRDRYIQTRRVVIAASGVGTIKVTFTDEAGATDVNLLTVNSTTIRNFHFDVSLDAENLTVKFLAVGGTSASVQQPAPLLHRCFIGYQDQQSLTNSTVTVP